MKNRHDIDSIRKKYSPILTIFGSSSCAPGSDLYQTSFNIGSIATKNGFTVANGGYTGTMDATAKGVKQNNGKVIGITTDDITKVDSSQYLTEEFKETSLMTRLDVLIGIGDFYLILPGSTGTLTELALLWDKQKLEIISIRPIILFGDTWSKIFNLMFINFDVNRSKWKKDQKVEENTYILKNINNLDELFKKIIH